MAKITLTFEDIEDNGVRIRVDGFDEGDDYTLAETMASLALAYSENEAPKEMNALLKKGKETN